MKTKEEILQDFDDIDFILMLLEDKIKGTEGDFLTQARGKFLDLKDEYASQFQQEWIPVEQSLPKEFGIYDVTAVYKGETFVTTVCYDLTIWLTYADVIAWKQQSQPYNPTQS